MNYARKGENFSALPDHRVALFRTIGRPSFYGCVLLSSEWWFAH